MVIVMTGPAEFESSTTNLDVELLMKASEINSYAHNREGEYMHRKISLMLGRMATQYGHIPVFTSTSIALIPDKKGIGVAMGEFTGSIEGFSYSSFPDNFLSPDTSQEGIVLQLSLPSFNDYVAEQSEDWRLNVLPTSTRDPSIEGFVIGIPLIEGQQIISLGDKPELTDLNSLMNAGEHKKEYSYRDYVDKIRRLTRQRTYMDLRFDGARLRALDKLMNDICFECPYLGEEVIIQSEYIRSPKPDNKPGFSVSSGLIGGVLRKYIYGPFQDYKTHKAKSDVQAVLYAPETADKVARGELTAHIADTLSTTYFIPLSEPHILTTIHGVQH